MTDNRKAAEEFILKFVAKIAPNDKSNVEIYQNMFSQMSDKAFDDFMSSIESGNNRLAVISPNFGKTGISVANNLKLAKELNHQFFQKILIEGDEDTPTYLTPIPYLVVLLPLRRQAQLLVKKISIPEDSKVIDDMTGQPTGRSQGSRLSYPEIQVLAADGLDAATEEFIKWRGGDIKGMNAFNDSISKTGSVSMQAIQHLAGGVEATKTFSIYLNCMHLQNTLV